MERILGFAQHIALAIASGILCMGIWLLTMPVASGAAEPNRPDAPLCRALLTLATIAHTAAHHDIVLTSSLPHADAYFWVGKDASYGLLFYDQPHTASSAFTQTGICLTDTGTLRNVYVGILPNRDN